MLPVFRINGHLETVPVVIDEQIQRSTMENRTTLIIIIFNPLGPLQGVHTGTSEGGDPIDHGNGIDNVSEMFRRGLPVDHTDA